MGVTQTNILFMKRNKRSTTFDESFTLQVVDIKKVAFLKKNLLHALEN